MQKIVLLGAGGHCKVIIDIIKSRDLFHIVGITEKQPKRDRVLDVPVIGNDGILKKLYNEGVRNAFICVGDLYIRKLLFNKVKSLGFNLPILTHKKSIISPYAEIKEGTSVMAGAIINAGAKIGINTIVNTGAVVEHDCKIGDNVHIAPGVRLAGGVSIGQDSFIGIGSSVVQSVNIGSNVTVGAGGVVIENIPDKCVAVGVPVSIIKTKTYL